jgi:phosphate butyryltransferase
VAQDEDVLKAIKTAIDKYLITPVLVGDRLAIQKAADLVGFNLKQIEIINEIDPGTACRIAVKYIHEGNGDILMKGLVNTGQLVKAILDKENGLLKGGLLSHLAFFESLYYHKILSVTDAALNIAPDLDEKASIIRNAVGTYHQLGIEQPLVAVLAPVETVNPKIESTQHGALLKQMQNNNQIIGCIIDGPLALDLAISYKAARHKGVVSEVAGNADILIAPDLNAGNLLYKSLNFLGGAVSAAIVCGATVPIVLTSRADDDHSKFLSIALAVATA